MSHTSTAAEAMAAIVRTITPDQLTSPTPCPEFDVRGLVGHLLRWGPSLAGAGRKVVVPPPESGVDLTAGDWRGDLLAHLDDLVSAWAPPAAWEGDTRVVGPTATPARLIGGMVVTELTVHAWDLAAATGQSPSLDDELLAYLHDEVAGGAEQARQMGFYGPEVPVPADAPTLDRVLGLTGRDPAWAVVSSL